MPRVPEPQVTPMTPKRAEAEEIDLERDAEASRKIPEPVKELSPETERTCTVLIPHLNMDLAVFVVCCFSCSCCGINASGNVVRVYPETVQGLMFYCSKV